MSELKLHHPLPEIDTARLRPGLRSRAKRQAPVAVSAPAAQRELEQRPKP